MRTARNQVVLPVSASETERLRDLLSGKRIDASFADGAHLRGRVKEIQDGLLVRVSGRLVRFCTLSGAFLTSVEGDRVPVSDGS